MKTAYYLLQGTLFRSQSNLNDLIEIHEVFQDENLIAARERVFNKYQSYVDVFLESRGMVYESYELAEKELSIFIDSYRKHYALNNPDLGPVDLDFDKGLFIYLVTDSTDVFLTYEGEKIYNKKHLVHSIITNSEFIKEFVFKGLQAECAFYKSNGFSIKAYNCEIEIPGLYGDKKSVSILKTPIDFQKCKKEKLV